MNNIQKKTYIDKDETDSMKKNKQTNEKKTNWSILSTYNNMTSKDYNAVYNIINGNFVTNYTDKNEWKRMPFQPHITSYNINITRFVGIASV